MDKDQIEKNDKADEDFLNDEAHQQIGHLNETDAERNDAEFVSTLTDLTLYLQVTYCFFSLVFGMDKEFNLHRRRCCHSSFYPSCRHPGIYLCCIYGLVSLSSIFLTENQLTPITF